MDPTGFLQPILGTDKKNPVFSVFRHHETRQYHVYYGLELFEVVPCDHEDPRFKLMLAHLQNVGATLRSLHRAFKVDPRTIKKWAAALKSGDAEKLSQALAGRGAGRKLTPPVEQYVRIRFATIYQANRANYSSVMRRELKDYLGVELSGETLRPLLGELKTQFEEGRLPDIVAAPPASPAEGDGDQDQDQGGDQGQDNGSCVGQGEGCAQSVVEAPEEGSGGVEEEEPNRDTALETSSLDGRSAPGDRREYAEICTTSQWCSHLGLLLFSPGLRSLGCALGPRALPVCQWMSQVLCGALNLEQSKLVSTGDLGLLLGGGLLGRPDHQRAKLGELARDGDLAREILNWNYQRLGAQKMTEFYYDPHTKHYTGGQNVLKGWCAKIRWADKVMHGDFVHSLQGQPLYLENTDNYEDMRKRFMKLEARFRQSFAVDRERELTWIVDRGIFSQEIFEWILSDPNKHLITWEKGYQRGGWPEGKAPQGSMTMERARNHSTDLRSYHFEWIEEPWPKEPRIRRLLVRATNPKANRIEVSILCDDTARSAESIIWFMFDRWVQENDFKYLDAHFGINQITSYQSENYEQLVNQLEDRHMKNAIYTALEGERRDERKHLGSLLVRQRDAERAERRRAKAISKLKGLPSLSPEQRQQLGRLKAGQKSAQRHHLGREKRIEETQQRLDRLDAKLANTDKEVSRLETLIGREAVRLCGEKKYLMDVIKITARNLFYEVLAPFKKAYDNYRDDHVWFRQLTRSGGLIEPAAEGLLHCHLIGTADYPKPVRQVATKLLAEINQTKPGWPDGSGRHFKLILGSKDAIQLAPSSSRSSTEK